MPRFTIDLPDEIDQKLIEISKKRSTTKAATMKKAFALLATAEKLQAEGKSLGIVAEDAKTHELELLGLVIGI
jgi:predicted transcriptional regulator